MQPWLIGKALSPFFVLLVVWLIGRPASNWVRQRMPEGAVKRVLLLDSEREPVKYMAAWLMCIAVLVAFCMLVWSVSSRWPG